MTTKSIAELTIKTVFADSLKEKLFYSIVKPTALPNPYLVAWNNDLGKELGLQEFDPWKNEEHRKQVLEYFGGSKLLSDKPIAMNYAGFQFGYLSCPLGDGRAIMLGEIQANNQSFDIQLKGCGRTPYSRFGDGLAVLRSTVREYLCSEAMHALGIPTTRALSIVASDEKMARREKWESAAMMTRVAPCHIRFGSFEVFFYTKRLEQVKELAEYTRKRYNMGNNFQEMFEKIVTETAKLFAKWQSVGFCHGVLNTDNMSILGLSIDYGPFAFMNSYNPNYVCNHSDDEGRYMYKKQPAIGYWNLQRLGDVWKSLIDQDEVDLILEKYDKLYREHYMELMRKKMGLTTQEEDDEDLLNEILFLMQARSVDYTIFWRKLGTYNKNELRQMFAPTPDNFDLWAYKYDARLERESSNAEQRKISMNKVNPVYILRTHLAQEAIEKAEAKNYSMIEELHQLLKNPYEEQAGMEKYAEPAPAWSNLICLSCSS